MKELISLIDELVQFGLSPNVKCNNKENRLKELLILIYSKFILINVKFDENDYHENESLSYQEIRKNVENNFPELTWYISVHDSHQISYNGESKPNVNADLGDPIDDLTDIILDLLDVKWRFENNSHDDASWYFDLYMRMHSEWHLVNLLKYLKDKLG